MPPYDDICEDCGRPVDDLVDGRCAECREDGKFLTFPGPRGLYDALQAWAFVKDIPIPEFMSDL